MKKIVLSAGSALVLMLGLSTDANAQTNDYLYKYVVKFVCGFVAGGEKLIGGEYRTAINIYNPHGNRTVDWEWDVSTTHGGDATPGPTEPFGTGGAFEVDCEILQPWYHEDGYAKGFVYILSRWPLDVAAVYTAGSASGDDTAVSSIDVEYVLGHRLSRAGNAGKPEY